MCDHPNREAAMEVIERGAEGRTTVWCDPCIAPLVKALNDAGIRTVASCCGHGQRPGNVMLADGRELIIARDFKVARQLAALFPDAFDHPDIDDAFPRVGKHVARRLGLGVETITVTFADEDVSAWRSSLVEIDRAYGDQPHLSKQKEAALERAAETLAECVVHGEKQ